MLNFFSFGRSRFWQRTLTNVREELGGANLIYKYPPSRNYIPLNKRVDGHEKMNNITKLIIFGVVAVAIIVIILVGINLYNSSLPKPPIDVNPSIDTSSIKVGQPATITIAMKNNDLKTHQIEFYFETSPKISVFAGTESQLVDYRYTITMDATSVSDTRAFTLTGTLDNQESSSTFPVVLHVTVDGTELQKTWGDFSIQVSAS